MEEKEKHTRKLAAHENLNMINSSLHKLSFWINTDTAQTSAEEDEKKIFGRKM